MEDEGLALEHQNQLRKANRRFDELNRENYSEGVKIDIPKTLGPKISKRTTTPSMAVKRILNSKKTWTNYIDELEKSELRLLRSLEIRPGQLKLKRLCTICGNISYSTCIKCGSRVCCLKCQGTHNDTRCTNF